MLDVSACEFAHSNIVEIKYKLSFFDTSSKNHYFNEALEG